MSQQKKVAFLTCIVLSAFIFPLLPAHADGGGSIVNFSDGSAQYQLDLGGQTTTSVSINLVRNTTIENATFMIQTSSSYQSPGQLWLDIDEDGQDEWNFTHPSYGSIGDQNVFDGGSVVDTISSTVNSMSNSSDIFLPHGLTIDSINLDTIYQSNVGGGFYPIGQVKDIQTSDVDGDALDDAVLLAQNGTSTEIHVFSMSSGGVSSIASHSTCASNKVLADDFDGDGYGDVASVNLTSGKLCIHMYNSTTSQFDQQVNNSISQTIIDIAVGDLTGDGASDLITIRNNGEVALQEFDARNTVFAAIGQNGNATINENNSAVPATLVALYVMKFDGPNSDYTAIVTDNSFEVHSTEVIYQASTGLSPTSVVFDGLPSGAIPGDLDGDSDIDFIASSPQGLVFANNTGSTWSISTQTSALDLTSARTFDHDGDGQFSVFIPDAGVTDNNPATKEGKLVGHHVTESSLNSTEFYLEPWTNPTMVQTLDFDGDGITDQVVAAGEGNQKGVYIGTWHRAMYDIDKNGDMDVSAEGYAGNGAAGSSPLQISDLANQLANKLSLVSNGWSYSTDGYGVKMSTFNMSYDSSGNGTFVLSNMSIRYTADFIVDINPHIIGNLTNIMNQKMILGSGTFSFDMPFNSSAQGSVNLASLSILYSDGAPNLVVPPTPVLRLDQLTSTMVQIAWQNQSYFGEGLLNFAVYRTPLGGTVDTAAQPYDSTITNLSIDVNVVANTTYSYYVRSIHDFGIVSNLSEPLNVTVPFPPAPGQIENVSASDRPNDDGSAILVSWDAGNSSVEEYHIFVSTSSFSNVSGMNIAETVNSSVTSMEIIQDASGQTLVDGTGYYIGVVGADEHGNYTTTVVSVGPIYPRNDVVLDTTVTISVTNSSHLSDQHTVVLDESFEIQINLESSESIVASKEVTVTLSYDSGSHQVDLVTDDAGFGSVSLTDFSTITEVTSMLGQLTIEASFAGQDVPTEQPLAPTSSELMVLGGAIIDVSIPSESELIDGQYAVEITLTSTPSIPDDLLSTGTLEWKRKSSDGSLHDEGTTSISGTMLLTGSAEDGQLLEIRLTGIEEHLFYSQTAAEVTLNYANDSNQNNTTEDWSPTDIDDVILSCPDLSIPFKVGASSITHECSLENPNPFSVDVSFVIESMDIVGVSFSADGLTLQDNETKTVTILLTRDTTVVLTSGGSYDSTITIQTTWTESADLTSPSASLLRWNIEDPIIDTTEPSDTSESTSSLQSILLPVGGGILVLVVVILVVSKIVSARSDREDEDDGDDWYEEAMDMVQPTDKPEEKEYGQVETKSLDTLKAEGKTIGEDAPEERGIDFSLGEKSQIDVIEESEEEPEEHQEEASDDGITIDEDGTEWYEDELGVWWYREQGWDDWAEWQD
jgi:hypothetical protein